MDIDEDRRVLLEDKLLINLQVYDFETGEGDIFDKK